MRDIPEDEPETPNVAPQAVPAGISQEQDLEMLRTAAQTPEGRALLNLAPGQAGAAGVYQRNYREESNRVTGGVEVEHGPDFRPLPPSSIDMYVRADGQGTTPYLDPYYVTQKKMVPKRDAQGKIQVTTSGEQVMEEEMTQVMSDPGAKMEDGKPVFTEEYKRFLDLKSAGKSLANADVRTDIMGGNYVDDGIPEGALNR